MGFHPVEARSSRILTYIVLYQTRRSKGHAFFDANIAVSKRLAGFSSRLHYESLVPLPGLEPGSEP